MQQRHAMRATGATPCYRLGLWLPTGRRAQLFNRSLVEKLGMTIVLVHGNPETEAIWDDLVPHLHDHDIVRLSPPGFGSAVPSGFDCSTDAYRDWLAGELGKLTQPIDLDAHDWGGGHVMRIAMDCPDLIQSWTTEVLGGFAADYVWHAMAQTCQAGESADARVSPIVD